MISKAFREAAAELLWNDKHAGNVAVLSSGIAKALSLDSDLLYLCGYCHDIGKVIIETRFPFLLDTKKFNAFERQLIRQHTLLGGELLYEMALNCGENIDSREIKELINTCIQHHERTDGSGYWGLKKISEAAGIVAVADCYSAIRENRVYSKSKSKEDAIFELKEMPLNKEYVLALERSVKDECNSESKV